MPVEVTSHTSVPKSGSSFHAPATMRAASSGVGGFGFGVGSFGFRAIAAGLLVSHPHRRPDAIAPLMMAWI